MIFVKNGLHGKFAFVKKLHICFSPDYPTFFTFPHLVVNMFIKELQVVF